MGVSWIGEVVSYFMDWELIFFDCINLLQAVAIFFIFAAKRENLLWIYKKHEKTQSKDNDNLMLRKKLLFFFFLNAGFIGPILRMKLCYVAEMDVQHTEMTSAEKSRTLTVEFRSRLSSGSN